MVKNYTYRFGFARRALLFSKFEWLNIARLLVSIGYLFFQLTWLGYGMVGLHWFFGTARTIQSAWKTFYYPCRFEIRELDLPYFSLGPLCISKFSRACLPYESMSL